MNISMAPLSHDDRSSLTDQFIAEHGWGSAERHPIVGDASFRNYVRLLNTENGESCILMDAPPPEDVVPFVKVGHLFSDAGLSSPSILAQNEKHGLLLLEDLGSESYTSLLANYDGEDLHDVELGLYRHAVDALCLLQQHESPAFLAGYVDTLLLKEVSLFTEWYLPLIGTNITDEQQKQYTSLWQEQILPQLDNSKQVIVHRDYHADNLLWLKTRDSIKKVGMIDFQDAVIGHPAYDLVSLLEDARRDIPPSIVSLALDNYIRQQHEGFDQESFIRDYAILGAQRNLKIIGIFSRLNSRDNKPKYLDYLPRVWGHLAYDLQHPTLSPLRDWLYTCLPEDKHAYLIPQGGH